MTCSKDLRYNTGNPICDALRFLDDAAFALLPRDAALKLGEFEKNLWSSIRWLAEKKIGWIDESLAAADRLRAEWQRRTSSETGAAGDAEPIT